MIYLILLLLQQATPAPKPAAPRTAAAHPTGNWTTSTSVSQMDDSKTVTLQLRANGPISAWPSIVHTPILVARCKEGEVDAFITIGTAPAVESGDSATVRIRLDQEPASDTTMTNGTDGKALFFGDGKEAILAILPHQRMVFRFTPFNSSPQETSFTLAGLAAAIKPLQVACKWDPKADAAAAAEAEAAAKTAELQRAAKREAAAREEALAAQRAKEEAARRPAQLIEELKSENARDRALAARAIGKLTPATVPPAAIPALIEVLRDPDENVRAGAAFALQRLGAHDAIPLLRELAAKDPSDLVRDQAKSALAVIK